MLKYWSLGINFLIRFISAKELFNLLSMCSIWSNQDNWSSIITPRNFIFLTWGIFRPLRCKDGITEIGLVLAADIDSCLPSLGWKYMWAHFPTFTWSWLLFIYLCKSLSKVFALLYASIFVPPVIKMLVSSANNINSPRFDRLTISFIYNKKRRGPRTEPWGTPKITISCSDCSLKIYVYCWRSCR